MTVEEFMQGYTMIYCGSPEEQASLCFDLFDLNHSGKITAVEFQKGLHALCDTAFALSLPLFYVPGNIPPTKDAHKSTVNEVAQKAMNNEKELKFEQFTRWIHSFRQIKEFVQYSIDR